MFGAAYVHFQKLHHCIIYLLSTISASIFQYFFLNNNVWLAVSLSLSSCTPMLVHSWNFGSDSHLLQRFCPTAAVLNEPFINLLSYLTQVCWKLCHLNCALCALWNHRQPSDTAHGLASFIWTFYRTCAGVPIFSHPIIIFRSVS